MKGGREILLNSKLLCQGSAEVRREIWVPVGDNLTREPEPAIDVVEVQLCNARPSYGGGVRQEYGRSGASLIHDGQDCIKTSVRWKSSDEVHCYPLEGPGIRGCGDFVQWNSGSVCKDFTLLTD